MENRTSLTQVLLTLPPRVAARFAALEQRHPPAWFASSDPPGRHLGSGGATAHLLVQAWKATAPELSFEDWLAASRKLVLHGGGDARRLPAYAAVGKMLMPIPVLRWSRGQSLTQRLLDLQMPDCQRLLDHAPRGYAAMIASGDVLLRFGRRLPAFPAVDVLGLGMWAPPDQARHFGVFFLSRRDPTVLDFFLQKPSPAEIRDLAETHLPLVDTGWWLLSPRAVAVLMERCGWDARAAAFRDGQARTYELYAQFGLALGQTPRLQDAAINALSCAVVPLPQAAFHHFGTSRQMVESMTDLQNIEVDASKLGLVGVRRRPSQHLLNSRFDFPLRLEEHHTLWVENSVIPASWRLAHSHVLCGVPENHWDLALEPGVCLNFAPVGAESFCVQACGMDDDLSGPLRAPSTRWFGRPAREWFARRGLDPQQAGLSEADDLGGGPLFPVLGPDAITPRFLEWLFAEHPAPSEAHRRQWLSARRLSASEAAAETNLDRLYAQRAALLESCLAPMMRNHRFSVFHRLDLASTAALFARTGQPLPEPDPQGAADPLQAVHDEMFRAAVLRHRSDPAWEQHEARSFARLREMIVREAQLAPVLPRCAVLEDQIVWGRSPVRLDLAGGWTDTPPYCLEHGGRVLNVAVDLNGQPPIQVFARVGSRPELVLRSIDLGVEERVRSYEELETYARAGSEFGLAKAALALAGFLPPFHAHHGAATLQQQLTDFGGGLELSMLCAVPKGSGLGTSSILAATLLATLSEVCGLGWDAETLFSRTLALEQMLTTGGGWQDQVGGLTGGIKLVTSGPGLPQQIHLEPTPLSPATRVELAGRLLLVYTGRQRLAKNLLRAVMGRWLARDPEMVWIQAEIARLAVEMNAALIAGNVDRFGELLAEHWIINQRMDPGCTNPFINRLFETLRPHINGGKLAGAGGGGFAIVVARSVAAVRQLSAALAARYTGTPVEVWTCAVPDDGLLIQRL